jgi:hypothetical protein
MGIGVSDFDFDRDLLDSLLLSRKGFLDFVKTDWDRVLHAAFIFSVQTSDFSLLMLNSPPTGKQGNSTPHYYET